MHEPASGMLPALDPGNGAVVPNEPRALQRELERLQHERDRLRRDLDSRNRMLQSAFEELKVKDDTILKYHRENAQLRGRLNRQLRDEADMPIVRAVFDFWKALRANPRLKLGPDRTKVILERLQDDPPTEPREFIWPVLGIVLDPTPKKNGTGFYQDLELALRKETKVDDYAQRGREVVSASGKTAREVIHDLGGDAADAALTALLELQREQDERRRREGQQGGAPSS